MKDTTIFILAAGAIAIFAIYRGDVKDVDNLINVCISAMAGSAAGYHFGYKDKVDKNKDNVTGTN